MAYNPYNNDPYSSNQKGTYGGAQGNGQKGGSTAASVANANLQRRGSTDPAAAYGDAAQKWREETLKRYMQPANTSSSAMSPPPQAGGQFNAPSKMPPMGRPPTVVTPSSAPARDTQQPSGTTAAPPSSTGGVNATPAGPASGTFDDGTMVTDSAPAPTPTAPPATDGRADGAVRGADGILRLPDGRVITEPGQFTQPTDIYGQTNKATDPALNNGSSLTTATSHPDAVRGADGVWRLPDGRVVTDANPFANRPRDIYGNSNDNTPALMPNGSYATETSYNKTQEFSRYSGYEWLAGEPDAWDKYQRDAIAFSNAGYGNIDFVDWAQHEYPDKTHPEAGRTGSNTYAHPTKNGADFSEDSVRHSIEWSRHPGYEWLVEAPEAWDRYQADAARMAQQGQTGIDFVDWLEVKYPDRTHPEAGRGGKGNTYLLGPNGERRPDTWGNATTGQTPMPGQQTATAGAPGNEALPTMSTPFTNTNGTQPATETTPGVSDPDPLPPATGTAGPKMSTPFTALPTDGVTTGTVEEPGTRQPPIRGGGAPSGPPEYERLLQSMFTRQATDLDRRLMANGALRGTVNSGGFGESYDRAQSDLAAAQSAQLGEMMFKGDQADRDRLLQKYMNDTANSTKMTVAEKEIAGRLAETQTQVGAQKFMAELSADVERFKITSNADLQKWLSAEDNTIKRYGIDKEVFMAELKAESDKYGHDTALKAANLQAAATRAAASASVSAARANAEREFQLGMERLRQQDVESQRAFTLGSSGQNLDWQRWQGDDAYRRDYLTWQMSPGNRMAPGGYQNPDTYGYGFQP